MKKMTMTKLFDKSSFYVDLLLTFVFESGDDQVESVGVRAPSVRHVLERHEIGARVDGADTLTGVPARQVSLQTNSFD